MENSINKNDGKSRSLIPTGGEPFEINPFLSREEKAIVKATFAAVLTRLDQEKAETAVMEIINRAYAELGQSPAGTRPEDRKKYIVCMAQMILSDLRLYYPQVTIVELAMAMRHGIRRAYGDYFGFNVIAVHGFVEKFLESDERKETLARQHRYLISLEKPEEPSIENKQQIMEEGLKRCEETYRKTGRIIDFGNVNYQMLDEMGKINLTNEQKNEILAMAEWEIKREQETREISLQKALYLIKNPPGNRIEIIARAKEIALRKYFDRIK